jgi:dTDP-4-amino-4,6-dideoxygalactose transaminase
MTASGASRSLVLRMNVRPKIPFLDLASAHRDLEDELVSAFRTALREASFVGGPVLRDFEEEFSDFCSARYCVAVSSGTDALRFALSAAGVQPGDTVVTVPNTFIATTEAISQVGARPEFVDIDGLTYTLDVRKLRKYLETKCRRDPSSERLISTRTGGPVTAVVPVHLYGQMADMDAILEIASDYGLVVIEDACQAHGAEYFSEREQRWRKAGSMGRAAAFSFYPGKNLGACGEGGAVTTNDEGIARRCQILRDHGQSRKYVHEIEGYNGRLDAIQAAILRIKLRHLQSANERRRAVACQYKLLFAHIPEVLCPHAPAWSRPVHHLYVVRVETRDALQNHLADAGIGTGIHYPVPLHLSRPYQRLGFKRGDFPISERATKEVLSLPMFPGLSPESQRQIVGEIKRFFVDAGRKLSRVG